MTCSLFEIGWLGQLAWVSTVVIFIQYLVISTRILMWAKRRDSPLALGFFAFILTCGFTHISQALAGSAKSLFAFQVEAWTLIVCALVGLPTAILFMLPTKTVEMLLHGIFSDARKPTGCPRCGTQIGVPE